MSRNINKILNITPVALSNDDVVIGRLPYEEEVAYRKLRETHLHTHAFRYDSRTNEILNITLVPDAEPLGFRAKSKVAENLLLIASAIQRSILIWLIPEIKMINAGKRLSFWGRAPESLLLAQALKTHGLEPIKGVEVHIRYDIDCRLFWNARDEPYLGVVLDIASSNEISIPVSELIDKGLSIVGKYICRREEVAETEYTLPRLKTIGAVSSSDSNRLLLVDFDGDPDINASEVILEPRTENLKDVLRLIHPRRTDQIWESLEATRRELNTANGKLRRIQTVLSGLRRHPITMGDGLSVNLGDLLTEGSGAFPRLVSTARPHFLVGPQGRNSVNVPDYGISSNGPYMYLQHSPTSIVIAVVCEARNRGRMEQFINMLINGFPEDEWRTQNSRYQNPYIGGLLGKYRLERVRVVYQESAGATSAAYKSAADQLLKRITETPHLAIVQTRKSYKTLRGDANPYFTSKAVFMSVGVPVQAICIENIEALKSQLPYILNQIALASYAKLDGIPWIISTPHAMTHEVVVGLGYSEIHSSGRLGSATRYVGITTLFSGNGRYLVWGLTNEVEYEHYAEALLESLRTTVEYVKSDTGWQQGDRVRLVCHCYKRLRNSQVDAVKALARELSDNSFTVEFAFLDVSWVHPYHIFDPSQPGKDYWSPEAKRRLVKGIGVPERGLCYQLDKHRGLLHVIGPNEIKTGDQGVPQPLLIELHPDSDFMDMTYLLRQIYHFTFMSWQSFFPASEPITIKYSRMIAQLLGNLKLVTGWDSRPVLLGSLRGRRWFL